MKTFLYVLRRCFCLCPWAAFDLWIDWKQSTDEKFAEIYKQQGESLIEPVDIADWYAEDGFEPVYEKVIMLVARPVGKVRFIFSRLWHPVQHWLNNRKWERWTRENL